jgi:Protein of unknown function (DUF3085)
MRLNSNATTLNYGWVDEDKELYDEELDREVKTNESWSMSISRSEAKVLLEFCELRGSEEFYAVKGRGAYMAAGLAWGGTRFYVKGCDPVRDPLWTQACREKFGDDEFMEILPVGLLRRFFRASDFAERETLTIQLLAETVTLV